ncbi:YkvI family membrane protein [Desulfothermobacter acidiphilus]|uniref:YkvI family membrane protein n=1 Tax=Desulfothermobacter acidiphilus TaxID=1938353 RepID=UPI003F8C0E69
MRRIGALAIAGTYVGTVVGAGFASGQEILQFFTLQGLASFPALLLAALLFFLFGLAIMEAGHRLRAHSYLEVIQWAAGTRGSKYLDGLIAVFLFLTLATMAAGAGALFTEQLGLHPWLGRIALLGLTLVTVLFGLSGVVGSISLIAPLLIAAALLLGLSLTWRHPPHLPELDLWRTIYRPLLPYGPLLVLVYVAYNLVMAVCVLAPLGAQAKKRRELLWGAAGGAGGLFLGAAAINLGLLSFPWEAMRSEVPMIHLAGVLGPGIQKSYALVLLGEVYTTAVASLFGLANRLVHRKESYYQLVTLLVPLAFAVSLLSFVSLVRYLYAAVGLAGCFFLLSIWWRYLTDSAPP